uniref:Wu:fc23c09 n=1 Tax=Seriola dumerili TaxID=41447 RepID=A0A3B4T9R4_SERDU
RILTLLIAVITLMMILQSTGHKHIHADYFMISLFSRVVQCSDKGVDRVPYGIPYNARYILLMNNHIDSIQLDLLNEYVSMDLGNGSESLPNAVLSPLCNLRTLNLDHNQLTSVPQGLPLSIKELYLKGNLIGQFRGGAFNGVSELLVLDLSANRLTNKGLLRESLLNATHLESLNLEGNRLKQVPRHLPRSLKTLNLEGNLILSIKKAAFSTLKNLEHLGLARNKIFKVAIGAFRTLPVLHQLDLCHNTLRQVPRQLPQGLHSVALSNNKIQSVPRDAFCWGDKSLTLNRVVVLFSFIRMNPGGFLPKMHQELGNIRKFAHLVKI